MFLSAVFAPSHLPFHARRRFLHRVSLATHFFLSLICKNFKSDLERRFLRQLLGPPSHRHSSLRDKTLVDYRRNSFKIHITFGPRLDHRRATKQQRKRRGEEKKYDEDFLWKQRMCKISSMTQHWWNERKKAEKKAKNSMFALAVDLMPVRCNMNNFAALYRETKVEILFTAAHWRRWRLSCCHLLGEISLFDRYLFILFEDIFYCCCATCSMMFSGEELLLFSRASSAVRTIFGCALTLSWDTLLNWREYLSTTCRRNMIKWSLYESLHFAFLSFSLFDSFSK